MQILITTRKQTMPASKRSGAILRDGVRKMKSYITSF